MIVMICHHFAAGSCRSCTLLDTPYPEQLAAKETAVAERLGLGAAAWLPPVPSPSAGFRNKAKMVAAGTANDVVLTLPPASWGEPDDQGGAWGEDLTDCPLYPAALRAVFPAVRALVRRAQVPPYDIARQRGELKHVIVTCSPAGKLMVRFVLRTSSPVPRLREHLSLLTGHRGVEVVTANVQPEHAALLEGAEEYLLTEEDALPMRLNQITLYVRPRSFFQTNTQVAAALYQQVSSWADAVDPSGVVDLFCGVGGFALHCAAAGRQVTGLELSDDAVVSARRSAAEAALPARFERADLQEGVGRRWGREDLVIVNPPRRGIGGLTGILESRGPAHLIYSSCHPDSLAADLCGMPAYEVRSARLFDMFPHTSHAEVAVLLRRR